MILTITLNPAIDKTIKIADFSINKVNRARDMKITAGGKGINVSIGIKAMNRESHAFALVGGRAGRFIEATVKQQGINFHSIEVEGETRTNLKIVDARNNTHTDVNEQGPQVNKKQVQALIETVMKKLKAGDVLVLGGCLAPGIQDDVYKSLILTAKEKGAFVILDADGRVLEISLEGCPDVIKPNIHELRALAKMELETQDDIIAFAEGLLKKKLVGRGILVSLEKKGSLWVTKDKVLQIFEIKTIVKSTVGAGDAMVAALAIGFSENMSDEEFLKLATAAAIAKISNEGALNCESEIFNRIVKEVRIKTLKSRT
ncbi:MAG: 1-phosphofructokinase [Alkaliphilus sp.]